MQYHVYITPSELNRQLTCTIDLPVDAISKPVAELEDLIRGTIAPFTPGIKHGLFDEFTVDGLREVGRTRPLPTPAWLASDETKNAIEGHHPMVGPLDHFLWSEFLAGVLSRRWTTNRNWKVNTEGLGYPILELTCQNELNATFGPNKTRLRPHLPKEWTLSPSSSQSHLSLTHPGVVSVGMNSFIEIQAHTSNVFPARTHPLFYVALYEFWQYLSTEPAWSHLSPAIMVDENRDTPEFSVQSLVNFGLGAASCRWGWWSLLSHVFAPRSRALDILVQYYPECYEKDQLKPKPSNMEMNTTLASAPPRLRVLHDPYGR